jgi:ubiquinone/menaquinone biosynthesis C-methylase UbiE
MEESGMMNYVKSQFGHPRGVVGALVGRMMAGENRERIDWAVSLLDAQPNDHILEIGYGPGLAVQAVAAQLNGGHISGVDVSKVMLKQASRLNQGAIDAGCAHLYQGSAERLPFESARFDRVFTLNTLHHWSDVPGGLAEIKRVLKPGGMFYLFEQPPMHGVTEESVMRTRGAEIETLLRSAGFTIGESAYAGLENGWAVCVPALK